MFRIKIQVFLKIYVVIIITYIYSLVYPFLCLIAWFCAHCNLIVFWKRSLCFERLHFLYFRCCCSFQIIRFTLLFTKIVAVSNGRHLIFRHLVLESMYPLLSTWIPMVFYQTGLMVSSPEVYCPIRTVHSIP